MRFGSDAFDDVLALFDDGWLSAGEGPPYRTPGAWTTQAQLAAAAQAVALAESVHAAAAAAYRRFAEAEQNAIRNRFGAAVVQRLRQQREAAERALLRASAQRRAAAAHLARLQSLPVI